MEKGADSSGENSVKEKKESIFYWSIFFIIAVIIIFFAANKFFSKEPEYPKVVYNNWEFTKMADLWWFEWQRGSIIYSVPLRFNPYEVESIRVVGNLNATKFNAQRYVYITFDFSNETGQNMAVLALAATELTQNIVTAINRTPLAACIENNDEVCEGRPIKSCNNTDEPVIYLREGISAGIVLHDSCIILTGNSTDLLKSVDRLLYYWYRIIE